MTHNGFIDGGRSASLLTAWLLVALLAGCASGGAPQPAGSSTATAIPLYITSIQGIVSYLDITLKQDEAVGLITGTKAKSADKAIADTELALAAAAASYAAYQAATGTKATAQQQIQAAGAAVSLLVTAAQQDGLIKGQDAAKGQELLALALALSLVPL
jgi:hypothetical protein